VTKNPFQHTRRRLAMAALTSIAAMPLFLSTSPGGAQEPIVDNMTASEFVGTTWINTPGSRPVTLASRRGKVTIVHFWTLGCINCKHNLPIYNRWLKQFAARGVEIIGVHTPETPGERLTASVAHAVKAHHIEYPVLVDSGGANWNRWSQHYWPTVYLLDRRGHIRYRWEGELEYAGAGGEGKMARLVEQLLKEGAG